VVPALLTLFVAWPVLIGQVWGLVVQSKLDDEALSCIEQSLAGVSTTADQPSQGYTHAGALAHCTQCGSELPAVAKFCPQCGAQVTTAPDVAG
jgi:hypothetical protein